MMHRVITAVLILLFAGICITGVQHTPSHVSEKADAAVRFDDYEELYFAILSLTDGPNADEDFFSLPEAARHLHFAALFDMEIMNGGLCQFFVNCGSSYASRISQSLRAVGVPEIADLYDNFVSGNGIDVSDLSAFSISSIDEYAALAALYPFDDFDDPYVALWQELNFPQVMTDYANSHPGAFR